MVLLRTGKNCLYQSVFVSAHSRSHRLLREFQFLSFWPKHTEKAVSFEEKFLSFCICLLKAKAQPKLSKSKKNIEIQRKPHWPIHANKIPKLWKFCSKWETYFPCDARKTTYTHPISDFKFDRFPGCYCCCCCRSVKNFTVSKWVLECLWISWCRKYWKCKEKEYQFLPKHILISIAFTGSERDTSNTKRSLLSEYKHHTQSYFVCLICFCSLKFYQNCKAPERKKKMYFIFGWEK